MIQFDRVHICGKYTGIIYIELYNIVSIRIPFIPLHTIVCYIIDYRFNSTLTIKLITKHKAQSKF